jgi:hypothetical protein
MAPVLWARLSRAYRKPSELRERAHGDGIEVGYDSPEAFEEVLWRTFWREKYAPGGIALWRAEDDKPEARAFFAEHMKKIVALRRPDRIHDGRYISKNNANIARLDLVGRMFPDAKILLLLRSPLEHAYSLLRQHLNFLGMHKASAFTRTYMSDIGHYEFGELHRPIAFPLLDALTGGRDRRTIDYWLGYWIAAFEYVRSNLDRVIVVSYEQACIDPHGTLGDLCRQLDVADEGVLPQAAALFRNEAAARRCPVVADRELSAHAERLHGALMAATRVGVRVDRRDLPVV